MDGQNQPSGHGQHELRGDGQHEPSGNGQHEASGNGQHEASGNGQQGLREHGQRVSNGNGQLESGGYGQREYSGHGQGGSSRHNQQLPSGHGQGGPFWRDQQLPNGHGQRGPIVYGPRGPVEHGQQGSTEYGQREGTGRGYREPSANGLNSRLNQFSADWQRQCELFEEQFSKDRFTPAGPNECSATEIFGFLKTCVRELNYDLTNSVDSSRFVGCVRHLEDMAAIVQHGEKTFFEETLKTGHKSHSDEYCSHFRSQEDASLKDDLRLRQNYLPTNLIHETADIRVVSLEYDGAEDDDSNDETIT